MKKYMIWPAVAALLFSALPAMAQGSVADKYREELFSRFIHYTTMDSQSREDASVEFPMTDEQVKTAKALYEEIKKYGFPTTLSDHHYIYVQIPSNIKQEVPILGFSAHYDTTPEIEGKNIKAQIHKNYQGGKILIRESFVREPGERQHPAIAIAPETDPHLKNCIGETIVTSDGNTMLSGDDKAGVAVVVTIIKTLAENPAIKHGPMQIVITPNEDIGMSAVKLDLAQYKPDLAYDFDGEGSGEVIVENFSAELYRITVEGISGHPSSAKENGMVDAYQPGSKLVASIPDKYWPQESEQRQPYFHVYQTEKQGASLVISGRSRYFDREDGKEMDRMIRQNADSIRRKFNTDQQIKAVKDTIDFKFNVIKQYENVKYGVHPKAADIVKAAIEEAGITPRLVPARAGTTTAMIMAKWGFGGYTIFTGQQRPHAYNEWLCEKDMFDSYRVGLNIIKQVVLQTTQAKK